MTYLTPEADPMHKDHPVNRCPMCNKPNCKPWPANARDLAGARHGFVLTLVCINEGVHDVRYGTVQRYCMDCGRVLMDKLLQEGWIAFSAGVPS